MAGNRKSAAVRTKERDGRRKQNGGVLFNKKKERHNGLPALFNAHSIRKMDPGVSRGRREETDRAPLARRVHVGIFFFVLQRRAHPGARVRLSLATVEATDAGT